MAWHELIGGVGVALILLLNFLVQSSRLAAHRPACTLGNAIGSAAILVSLSVNFNPPAALVEIAWLAISLYGFARHSLRRSP
ncbi:MAG: hypothetical protein FJX68_03525 [Alphaproteobacteria bacterium]|nr:hypothetical protein [Alphaproteobacteria bacterium]